MKDDFEKLRVLRVPEPDPLHMERARHRARIAFENRSPEPGPERESRRGVRLLAGLAVVIAVLAMVAIGLTHRQEPGMPRTSANEALLRQFEALFPDRLLAVIERGGGVNVELADGPVEAVDQQSVMVTLRGNKETVNVLGYSGGNVCLDLGGRKLCFEMLITDDGGVILAGSDFVWTRANPIRLAGYRVEAAPLERQL